MAVEFLDLFELVAITVFNGAVFGCREKMVAIAVSVVRDEACGQDTVIVGKEGFVAVTEIETPDPDCLVGGGREGEFAVMADIQREYGQLVAVKREIGLEGIDKEDFDCGVQGRKSKI